jgi:hypothetical protein
VHSLAVPFNVGDYSISGTQTLSLAPGGQGAASLKLTASTFYSGMINAACDASALSGAQCVLSPANPITVAIGGTAILTATINVPNNANAGTYNINVATHDTTGAPSHSFTVALTVAQDFHLASSTPSQSVNAGQTSGPYSLTILPVGSSFDSAVTLACSSGMPAQAQCIFNPSTPQTPGASAVDVVMSISTVAPTANVSSPASHSPIFYPAWLLLPVFVTGWAVSRSPRKRRPLGFGSMTILSLLLLTFALLSCGGVSSGGGGGTCSSIPSVPTGLAATSTTNTGTTLSWTPATVSSGCSATYAVYQNAALLTTPTNPTYNVSGLSAATTYSFAVAARDSYGSSAQSPAISVTTLSSGTLTGVYHITVTGSSHGTNPDAGQSVQVTLVVN